MSLLDLLDSNGSCISLAAADNGVLQVSIQHGNKAYGKYKAEHDQVINVEARQLFAKRELKSKCFKVTLPKMGPIKLAIAAQQWLIFCHVIV